MTFSEYQALSSNLRERAYRLSKVFTEEARELGEKVLGSGRDHCFIAAHNWRGQWWMSEHQDDAARRILWLQAQSWKPGEMADRIIARAWKKVAA